MAPPPTSPAVPTFLFATCQIGAEAALKQEVARDYPGFQFAYSRPGFLTFRLPAGVTACASTTFQAVFARTWGFSVGKVVVDSLDAAASEVCRLAAPLGCEALHVWQRDLATIGFRGFEPHITPAALAAEEAIRRQVEELPLLPNWGRVAEPQQHVCDCIVVEPHEWWIGHHWATSGDARFAGGIRPLKVPEDMVSRAYLKMQEALAWSELPIQAGQACVEIGCAPGGASQYLLERGLEVIGIDPAQVDERVTTQPNFRHVRKRGADVRRREFRGVKWLTADMNVAPEYTLDTTEAIVTHDAVNIDGLLLTLKLPEWDLAAKIPSYLQRVRGWGYRRVRARQLAHNRQEICVSAMRQGRRRRRTA